MDSDAPISAPRHPTLRPTASETPPRTWFEAPTSAGPLRLCVTGAVRHAADAAIALYRCGELLDALDEWTALALGWRWIAPPSPTTSESHACAHWRPDGGAAAGHVDDALSDDLAWQVELPWTLLRALPAPANLLARRLHWSEVPVVLAAAQMHLGADELQLLESGGAVVMPESMGAEWRGLLRAADEPARAGWGLPVVLRAPLAARRIASGSCEEIHAVDDGNGAWCEVRLGGPRALAGDCLTGWHEGDLGEIGARASLWRCATDLEAARPLATGRLMPWGDGWALALEVLCGPPRAAAVVHGDAEAGLKARP